MEMCLQKINELITLNRIEDAIKELNEYIDSHPDSDEAFFMRGKLHWRMGDKRQAMNDYNMAVEINPESSATRALENAHAIQSFFNPDLLNP